MKLSKLAAFGTNKNTSWGATNHPNHQIIEVNDSMGGLYIPSLKLTVRTQKWMVRIRVSFWDGPFSRAFAVSFREAKFDGLY